MTLEEIIFKTERGEKETNNIIEQIKGEDVDKANKNDIENIKIYKMDNETSDHTRIYHEPQRITRIIEEDEKEEFEINVITERFPRPIRRILASRNMITHIR